MQNEAKKGGHRMLHVDWLKASACHLVLALHCIHSADEVFEQSKRFNSFAEHKNALFRYLVQGGIPMFFVMSGQGASQYPTEKMGFGAYAQSKIKKLGLAFVFAIFAYLIPSLYIRQPFAEIGQLTDADGQKYIEWDFLKFAPAQLNPQLTFKLGQLWFVPVLIIVSIMIYPLLAYSRRRHQGQPFERLDGLYIVGQIILLMLWTALMFTVVGRDKTNFWTRLVPSVCIMGLNFVIQGGFSHFFQSLEEGQIHPLTFGMPLVGPLTSIALNFYKKGGNDKNFYTICMMIMYHTNFMVGGFMYGIFEKRIREFMAAFAKTGMYPIFIVGTVMLYGVFLPGNYSDVGYMYMFPIYDDTVIQSLFTSGSWVFIYFLTWYSSAEMNNIFDLSTYKYVIGSSMNLYLCHDLWINMVVYFCVWPYCDRRGGSMSFYLGIFLILVLTEAGCALNYYMINKLYSFLVPNTIKPNSSYRDLVSQIESQNQQSDRIGAISAMNESIQGNTRSTSETYSKEQGKLGQFAVNQTLDQSVMTNND